MSHDQKFQDEIELTLNAQKIVVHDNVRVNVSISAQVDPTQGESEFRIEIQNTLKGFIDADWKIQSIQRSKGTGKYESVYVQATARVPERENYQLTDRANAVSRIGFELVNPNVDYSLSFDEIQDINRVLRLTLIANALFECNLVNAAYKNSGARRPAVFRVSSSNFNNNPAVGNMGHMVRAQGLSPMSPVGGGGSYGMEADAASPMPQMDVNVSTRFSMVGNFTLRAVAN